MFRTKHNLLCGSQSKARPVRYGGGRVCQGCRVEQKLLPVLPKYIFFDCLDKCYSFLPAHAKACAISCSFHSCPWASLGGLPKVYTTELLVY